MTIAEFLLEYATNEKLREDFAVDAKKALAKRGIEGEKAALLLAGKLRTLRFKIEGELEIDGEMIAFETIWWVKKPKPPRS